MRPAANLLVGNREFIRPEVERIVAAQPHVKLDSFRELRVLVGGQWVKLVTVRLGITRDIERLTFTQGDPDAAFDAAMHDDAILVSQPFLRRFHLGLGDALTLNTPSGAHTFRIAGVYLDYTTEGGVVLVDWPVFQKYWHDPAINGIGLYLDKNAGVTPVQLQARDCDRCSRLMATISSNPTASCARRSSASSTRLFRSPIFCRPSASSSPRSAFF